MPPQEVAALVHAVERPGEWLRICAVQEISA